MVKDEESEELINQSRKQEQQYKEEFKLVFLTSREGRGRSNVDILN